MLYKGTTLGQHDHVSSLVKLFHCSSLHLSKCLSLTFTGLVTYGFTGIFSLSSVLQFKDLLSKILRVQELSGFLIKISKANNPLTVTTGGFTASE